MPKYCKVWVGQVCVMLLHHVVTGKGSWKIEINVEKVILKLSSLLEGLWSTKLDRHNSWERSPDYTPP